MCRHDSAGGDPAIAGLVPSDIEFRRNRLFKPATWKAGDPSYAGFVFRNNIVTYGTHGIFGSNVGSGNAAINTYFPNAIVRRNVFAGPNAPDAASSYPPDNTFVASFDAVEFVDLGNRNYRLSESSPYNNAATDGTDIGANIDALEAALAGPPPAGPDTTPPAVRIDAPARGAVVSGTAAVRATASDNVGVAGVRFRLDGVNLGAEDLVAPYSLSWNTAATSNGMHTLTAVARDAAGNATVSAGVTVIVVNLP